MKALAFQRRRQEELKREHAIRSEKRLQLWRDVLVAKWYRAFSQLVADPQYAVMGVFLLTVIGKVCGILNLEVTQDTSEPKHPSPAGLDRSSQVDFGDRMERLDYVRREDSMDEQDFGEKISRTGRSGLSVPSHWRPVEAAGLISPMPSCWMVRCPGCLFLDICTYSMALQRR